MVKFGVLVLLATLAMAMGQGVTETSQCQVCQADNQVSCESESTYYICLGDRRFGPYSCEADEVCTNSVDICVNKNQIGGDIKNVCGDDDSACQSCPANKKFTCVSSTQAARCVNGEVSPSLIISCGEDEVCVSDAETEFNNVCVPNCVADFAKWNASCSNAVYTPPTLSPPTTPSPADLQGICQQAATAKTTRYFFAYVDSTCRTYVYCERSTATSSVFTTAFSGSCVSPNPYFNTATGRCQSTISDSCRTEAPTTTQAPTTPAPSTSAQTTASDTATSPQGSTASSPQGSTETSPPTPTSTPEPTPTSTPAPTPSTEPTPTSTPAPTPSTETPPNTGSE